uniref:Neuropeptide NPF-1 n=1 Tax=Leptinotarsa decemlineata TaxID=7539 RepID=NPF1_LEPDE|nr:RecName: Full=Neuropeptide NPF-1; Short=Led-NPF-1; AltName: Full=Short neuropeptide F I [Leptinotarsa decemlineata]
ARGPQLRLRF